MKNQPPTPPGDGNVVTPGLRINRVPNRPVRRAQDGSLTIALWLQRDGRFNADVPLRLSADEAELLHAQLCYALDNEPVPELTDHIPDCRRTTADLPRVRWP
ncbi:hypothetical protein [Streptomyces sp. MAR4 CNX-425]|uniref:hypothetical protein n=1 Tax=Streptomyces sp. MAR4 CNX-425 TaxID=3406343 RepID=UPI003B50E8F3